MNALLYWLGRSQSQSGLLAQSHVDHDQRGHGFDVWQEPFVTLRVPKLFDLKGDPFERADHESANYDMWRFERVYLILPAVDYVSQHLATYAKYPPRQKPGSFNLEAVLDKLQENPSTN